MEDETRSGMAKDSSTMVIGIHVASEAHQTDRKYDICLGIVVMKKERLIPLSAVRREICHQLHCEDSSFSFLTYHGWPINSEQEKLICLSQIMPPDDSYICVQRCYGKPRVGVVSNGGRPLGFVFADINCSLSELRDVINEQIESLIDYSFIDRNDWPIAPSQEPLLLIVDLLQGSSIRVQLHHDGTALPALEKCNRSLYKKSEIKAEFCRAISAAVLNGNNQLAPNLPFRCIIDKDRPPSPAPLKQKFQQILISYVRAEAADHAVRLKTSLEKLGYSVYLDVHEIKSGVDWQDALNNAVSNCEVFVPLVTPRYGETQWTNREVKLADVLLKFILPISFLNHWPPKCLAIQFATTQYIPWKLEEVTSEEQANGVVSVNNIRIWGEGYIRKVANEIIERIKTASTTMQDSASHGQLSKRISTLRSYPVALPEEFKQMSQHRDGRPLVVVSLHPAQNGFGHELSRMLEDAGFEVWLSTQLLSSREASALTSQRSLEKFPTMWLSDSQATLEVDDALKEEPLHKVFCDRLRRFQEKADEAGIVVWIVSKEFAESKMTREQVFYCEQRKRMIPVLYEDVQMPCWMSMLIGTQRFEDARNSNFEGSIKARIRKAFDTSPLEDLKEEEINEEKLTAEVKVLKQKIAEINQLATNIQHQSNNNVSAEEFHGRRVFVYASGSVKFFSESSEAICKAIGSHLARLDGVQVVTGGFYGVGETIGQSYHTKRIEAQLPSNILHVLPMKESQDFSCKGRQNPDKTFQEVPYGRTIFIGDSVRERESITSRAFDICILIEGGPGAAHEAQQFIWNDHIVIPIRTTGGAAAGFFTIPEKMFELPVGVSKEDWDAIANAALSPDAIGQAVANIVTSVRDRLALDSPTFDLGNDLPILGVDHSSGSFPTVYPAPEELVQSPRKKRLKWLSTDGEHVEFSDSD